MTTPDTPSRRLAVMALPELDELIEALRDSGLSWREIAADLCTRTGGVVNLSHETVRTWHEKGAA